MTVSIWRYAHLALAIISSAFLLILSVTGVILAYDAIDEKAPAYRVENFQELNLGQVLPTLRDSYFEVIEVKVDHNDFVTIDALDENGNPVKSYIDPNSGKKIGDIKPKSDFINWTTALHRSLFLKETGRAIVGVVSFILFLISISGFVLILKRQQGIKHFFTRIRKDFFSQYFHVVSGRLLLIPILIVALTGTIIFMVRLDFFKGESQEIKHTAKAGEAKDLKDIPFFKNTTLDDVERIEFPFVPDDEAEPFIVHLKDRSVSVNQVTGEIISETKYPYSAVLEKINLDLHTGKTSRVWAFILGLASLNIVFFIYTGFVIMFRRTRTKIKNQYKSKDAEIVLLVGSENGTTLTFADNIHKQLLGQGKKSFLAQMNQYEAYPNAQQLVIFTSTYGLGEAPTNANRFENLVKKTPQDHPISFSVVGFGSKSYADYCEFAVSVNQILNEQSWATELVNLCTVNDRSTQEFVHWAQLWSEKSLLALATAPTVYESKIPNLKEFEVVEKSIPTEENSTFKIILKPTNKQIFESGDLLAIYPENNNKERFYSVGKVGQNIQLLVKLFPGGLGSEYLNQLKIGSKINGRIMENAKFHLPNDAQNVAMIANGTGIAPFLGMIDENSSKKNIRLYSGFRFDNSQAKEYQKFGQEQQSKGHLESLHLAFSREENKQYVMDLIKNDEVYFADLLKNGGIIMICGALKMQRDVEKALEEITLKYHQQPLSSYENQILTDCY
ncbi:sulfite reductase (NADPH) flavoprotein alpha-component [Soonwooa buanensis]|uniref:NADPH--hemoprotein reductase n=1 Tax=Soonwooa buanensis TaxID=619805 RepID=A0A1T5CME4_9FLAO|nr:PepSY domain-containing protein [Soonwooa buanensis]SKB60516.1 sulfite reductase (NADPH) flavoprotein alpha-component [Soonwooa buanensis]